VIKARESEVTNKSDLDFVGGYSYLANSKIESKINRNQPAKEEEYDPTNPEHAKDPYRGWV
jgi:hypothetical protein